MKKFLFVLITACASLVSQAQYQRLEVESIDNGGLVPGKTYRIYVVMTNDTDRVDVVFGDSLHPLVIQSTKAFYQSSLNYLAKNC